MDPETFKKERGKRLAKESRKRKKEYLKTLEAKVEMLEEKVARLTKELETYKSWERFLEIGNPRGVSAFESIQNMKSYGYQDLPKFLEKEGSTHRESISILRYINSK